MVDGGLVRLRCFFCAMVARSVHILQMAWGCHLVVLVHGRWKTSVSSSACIWNTFVRANDDDDLRTML